MQIAGSTDAISGNSARGTIHRMAGPFPFGLNPNDPNGQQGGQPPFLDPNAAFDPNQNPNQPPMGIPPGPGLFLPDEPQYDPETDPVHQRLSNAAPLDLNLDLGDEQEQKLVKMLCEEIDRYKNVTSRRFASLSAWRVAHEMLPPGTGGRWHGCSDIPSMLTRMACNSHHTRLNQQILNATPPFTAIARRPDAKDKTTIIEECMAAVLDQADWPQVADDLHRELVIAGNVFLRVTYERETARIPQRQVEHSPETRDSLLTAGVDMHEAVWHSIKGVKFGHVDEPIYDGVKFRVIPFEDGVICPAHCRDPEEAIGIGERRRLRGVDLLAGVKNGYYRKDAIDELLEKPSSAEPMERIYRKDEQGLLPDAGYGYTSHEDSLYREYEIYELCWQYDVDDDDQLEWVVVHLDKESRKILGLRWMEYEHGRPYYLFGRYIHRTAELFGMGIPEMIAAYHDGDTAVVNQLVDHQDLSLNLGGNFAYTGLSGYDPEKTILQLGRPLKFENLAETEFKQLPPIPLPSEAYRLNEMFKNWVDLLTATSNPSLGKETDTQKTLGEVQLVFNASNQIFEDVAARVARSLHAKAWDHARWLTAQYSIPNADGGIEYRRTAAPDVVEFAQINPADLSAAVDLVPTGVTQLSDMGTRIQMSTLIHTQLMQLLASAQAWLPFANVVMLSFGQYMKAMSYPLREKVLAALEQAIQQLLMQQQMQQQAMMMAQMQQQAQGQGAPPGGPQGGPPGGGGIPPQPAGDIGGPPAGIQGPPPLPPQSAFPAPVTPL